MDFSTAWARGRSLLEGARRIRLPGAEPGVELSALDWGGEGELVVLHHANGFCAATLAPVAVQLRDRYRVVALDARGHGESTPVDPLGEGSPYAWSRLAEDAEQAVRALLERTGRSSVAMLVGHSFGGTLMLRVAERLAERVGRVLLCDPVLLPLPSPSEPSPAMQGNAMAEATRRRRDHFESREAAFEHCRTRGLFARFAPESLALYVGEGMREVEGGGVTLACDREVEAAVFEGGLFEEVVRDLEQATARVLFVHAGRGNFSLDYYRTLADRIPNASVCSEDFGHLFPLEVPDRAVALAEELLQAPGGVGASASG
jgi:pimeloyl-ACP methyl ester carboxylesterase